MIALVVVQTASEA
jgi:hypothetical protein